jgi:hypothetical protein
VFVDALEVLGRRPPTEFVRRAQTLYAPLCLKMMVPKQS